MGSYSTQHLPGDDSWDVHLWIEGGSQERRRDGLEDADLPCSPKQCCSRISDGHSQFVGKGLPRCKVPTERENELNSDLTD